MPGLAKPLAIDLFCGLGGWTDGLIAEGYDVTGYDIEEHAYGEHRYQGHLIIQDVKTIHGAALKDAALIVASPPCQEYSYMAMPWKLAKAKAAAIRADATGQKLADLNCLFNECFRIQREASFAAGHHIPLVIENVRGAQPWVGRARWNFGSFYLWGDVPALMPATIKAQIADSKNRGSKNNGGSWFNIAHNTTSGKGQNPDGRKVPSLDGGYRTAPGKNARFTSYGVPDCVKVGGGWFGEGNDCSVMQQHNSKSPARKFASAMIAKIPLPLSRHIGASFRP